MGLWRAENILFCGLQSISFACFTHIVGRGVWEGGECKMPESEFFILFASPFDSRFLVAP
jgi:hypothetical protein